jgi:hypothetical protein
MHLSQGKKFAVEISGILQKHKVPHTFVKHWAKFPSVSGAVFFFPFLQSSLWGHICTACGAQLAKT